MVEVLKVSSKSNPGAVAGAVAGAVRRHRCVEIQVVGAGALNQAIKALAIARGYMAASESDLTCRPTFTDVEIAGERRTAIRLRVEICLPAPGAPASERAPGHSVVCPVGGQTVPTWPVSAP